MGKFQTLRTKIQYISLTQSLHLQKLNIKLGYKIV